MKKILIICVNYNSYEALKNFLESVNHAASKARSICKVKVWVADNSSTKQLFSTNIYAYIDCTYYACENDGYIGTAEKLLENDNWRSANEADYFIISNVDLSISEDTFIQICDVKDQKVGWIAPRIYSKCRNTEENPQALNRYSKTKLNFLLLLYEHPILYKLYIKTVHILVLAQRRHNSSIQIQNKEVYAGSGAIFIFTNQFISKIAPFHFPCFLYGEELFFAELIRRNGLKTIFYPNIYIENKTPNVSTKELNYKTKNLYCANAIRFILANFY